MKTFRWFIFILVAGLLFSIWGPAPVYASQVSTEAASAGLVVAGAKEKLASLTVDNRTGGTLYINLSGPKNYYFTATKQGKTTFSNIAFGKYTVTVRASNCNGSLTYNKNLKGKDSLKPFVCK